MKNKIPKYLIKILIIVPVIISYSFCALSNYKKKSIYYYIIKYGSLYIALSSLSNIDLLEEFGHIILVNSLLILPFLTNNKKNLIMLLYGSMYGAITRIIFKKCLFNYYNKTKLINPNINFTILFIIAIIVNITKLIII